VKREDIIFLNQYQRQILEKLRDNICQAVEFLDKGHPIDFANFSLNECLNNLGKLSGEVFCKEILESIFSSFCIGK
jgi:tRNA U34 5-carboxymethylaminomethyl modifying GTPase MnmE/TrmE